MKPVFTSKYEATKHMKRHIIVTTTTEPSQETSRWRIPETNHKFGKQRGIQERIDKKVDEQNVRLSQRLYDVVTEDRQNRTTEYAPGWRTGLSGTVIDCYPTEQKQVLNYKKFREDNRERDQKRIQKKLNIENQNIHQYLVDQKTSYSQAEQQKVYEKNRVLYRLYSNRPHTALHLAIYETAAKELQKDQIAKDNYSLKGSSVVSPSNSGVFSMNDNGAIVFSPHIESNAATQPQKSHKTSRPHTISGQNSSGGVKNKLLRKINEIQSVSDFINMSIDNKLDFKDWDRTTNDNVKNSSSNKVLIKNRIRPGYREKYEYKTNYLSEVPNLATLVNTSGGEGVNNDILRIFVNSANGTSANKSSQQLSVPASSSSLRKQQQQHQHTIDAAMSFDLYRSNGVQQSLNIAAAGDGINNNDNSNSNSNGDNNKVFVGPQHSQQSAIQYYDQFHLPPYTLSPVRTTTTHNNRNNSDNNAIPSAHSTHATGTAGGYYSDEDGFNLYTKKTASTSPPALTRPKSSSSHRPSNNKANSNTTENIVQRNIQSAKLGRNNSQKESVAQCQLQLQLPPTLHRFATSPPKTTAASPTLLLSSSSLYQPVNSLNRAHSASATLQHQVHTYSDKHMNHNGGDRYASGRITYHEDPLECVVVPKTITTTMTQQQQLQYHDVHYHSDNSNSNNYVQASVTTIRGSSASPRMLRKNVSFDDNVDSMIIDYDTTTGMRLVPTGRILEDDSL